MKVVWANLSDCACRTESIYREWWIHWGRGKCIIPPAGTAQARKESMPTAEVRQAATKGCWDGFFLTFTSVYIISMQGGIKIQANKTSLLIFMIISKPLSEIMY